jgi:Xaa-Pro aminopeptidase
MNILFGMRIEDTVIVREDGCTRITDLGKDLVIVRQDVPEYCE